MEDNRNDFDILNKMKKLPGGLVIIPLVLAVIIATFYSVCQNLSCYLP